MELERRFGTITQPNNDNKQRHVEGYAAVFNSRTLLYESDYDGWQYYEEIAPEAFNGADMSDVIFKYNHADDALVLARTSNSSLRLAVDAKGLKIDADIADTTIGNDVYKLIQRGDLLKMSFAFIVKASNWSEDRTAKVSVRRITQFGKIFDVSAVDFPAYDDTSIEARDKSRIQSAVADKQRRQKLYLLTY